VKWIADNLDLIFQRAINHVALALPPIVCSFVLSLPLSWFASRLRIGRSALLTSVGLLYAVPSLPLFIALPAFLGTNLRDPINVVVALTLYGIALMVQTATGAFDAVDNDVAEAATAIGFSSWSHFWRVDLPLAGPVLLAGIRVVAVSTVSLATVGAVLGVKSLGLLFTDGIQRNIPEEIAAGIIATAAVALFFDLLLLAIGRTLMPWSHISKRTDQPLEVAAKLPVTAAPA
jgi:osmoprotectant transport system permease protein